MSENPLYKKQDTGLRLLVTKREAAAALGISTRVLDALERRGEIVSVRIAPCFPKQNPAARSRRGPQPMKRYSVDSLREYVEKLQNAEVDRSSLGEKTDRSLGELRQEPFIENKTEGDSSNGQPHQ